MKESLPANTTISHYRLLSRLGAGGMGEVYLAEDTKLERKVALKLLPGDFISNEDRLRRFIQEAKAAAALSHPNIAHIYEVGEASATSFIAMEYVEGQTLDAKIKGRALNSGEIVDIAMQVADALDEAHTKGITHRDIKPSNIMITSRGQAKVLDFGLARISVGHNPQRSAIRRPAAADGHPAVSWAERDSRMKVTLRANMTIPSRPQAR